jgi:hypothetical protein
MPMAGEGGGVVSATPPLAYIIAPVDLHRTQEYQDILSRARIVFQDHLIVPGVYAHTDHWRKLWPQVRTLFRTGIVIPRVDRSIGSGCFREVWDFILRDIPLYTVDQQRCFEKWKGMDILPLDHNHYAEVW